MTKIKDSYWKIRDKFTNWDKVDACNKYFYKRRLIGESTVELILYKNVLDETEQIESIAKVFKELDNVEFGNGKKVRKGKLDRLMFISYIDCEEERKLLRVYNRCIENKNYPEIPDLQQNIEKYVKKLKFVYREYKKKIIPMLASKITYSYAEYEGKTMENFDRLDKIT